MRKTMLAALAGLALVACAQMDDEEGGSQPLVDEESSGADPARAKTCAGRGDFDLDEFVNEIFPILNGDIDLNDPESGDVLTGCTRGPCHGQTRPDSFTINASLPPEQNLEAFACFVDLRRPKRSQVIVCPQGDEERCDVGLHPGGELFLPPDLNYDRVLRYIRDSRR